MSDVFVALPPATAEANVIFGKNSDRPPTEVQEVVYIPGEDHAAGTTVQCTFLEIEQTGHTHSTILSKPAWSWGAEMGSNEHGVCIGNTAVWTKLCNQGDQGKKLIGGDFVRLGLERGDCAKGALEVMTGLLEKYGQSGPCCEEDNFSKWTYNNSFIIADRREAWVLETAGQHWAAEHVTNGVRNISGTLSISTKIDTMSSGLIEAAQSLGLWKPEDGDFDFAKAFSAEYTGMTFTDAQKPENRMQSGKGLLESLSKDGNFSVESMFSILRDVNSSICFHGDIVTAASHVSVLTPRSSSVPCSHWLTATPDPNLSVFKPFVFCPNPVIGKGSVSGSEAGYQATADRRHLLYKMHEKGRQLMMEGSPQGQMLKNTMQHLESDCIDDVKEFLKDFSEAKYPEIVDLFKDVVDTEIKFYK